MKLFERYPKTKVALVFSGILFLLLLPLAIGISLLVPSLIEVVGYIVLLIGSIGYFIIGLNALFALLFFIQARKQKNPYKLYIVALCLNILAFGFLTVTYAIPLSPSSAIMKSQKLCGQRAEEHFQRVEAPLNDQVGIANTKTRQLQEQTWEAPESQPPTLLADYMEAQNTERDLWTQLEKARKETQRIYSECRRENDPKD